MKRILSILVMVLLVLNAVPAVLAEEVDPVADETVDDTAETPEDTEEDTDGINPDQPILHRLELVGEWVTMKLTSKVRRAEYRLQIINERMSEMENMERKYANELAKRDKYVEKARAKFEKHMGEIQEDLEDTDADHAEVVLSGLARSTERLRLKLEAKPENAGIARALEVHERNLERVRTRVRDIEEEEEEETDDDDDETDDEEEPEEEPDDEEDESQGNQQGNQGGAE